MRLEFLFSSVQCVKNPQSTLLISLIVISCLRWNLHFYFAAMPRDHIWLPRIWHGEYCGYKYVDCNNELNEPHLLRLQTKHINYRYSTHQAGALLHNSVKHLLSIRKLRNHMHLSQKPLFSYRYFSKSQVIRCKLYRQRPLHVCHSAQLCATTDHSRASCHFC